MGNIYRILTFSIASGCEFVCVLSVYFYYMQLQLFYEVLLLFTQGSDAGRVVSQNQTKGMELYLVASAAMSYSWAYKHYELLLNYITYTNGQSKNIFIQPFIQLIFNFVVFVGAVAFVVVRGFWYLCVFYNGINEWLNEQSFKDHNHLEWIICRYFE